MDKDIFDIIREKDFSQLSKHELAEINEYCKNKEEFFAMKQILIHSKNISDGPKILPREETKEKLDELFHATHGQNRKFTPFYFKPIVQIAAVFLVGFAVWMFVAKSEVTVKDQLAVNSTDKKEEIQSEELEYKSKDSESNQTQTEKTLGHNSDQNQRTSSERNTLNKENKIYSNEDALNFNEPLKVSSFSRNYNNDVRVDEVVADLNSISEKSVMYDSKSKDITVAQTEGLKEETAFVSKKSISMERSSAPNLFEVKSSESMKASDQVNVLNYLVVKY